VFASREAAAEWIAAATCGPVYLGHNQASATAYRIVADL
jgi:hypothetical protein